MNKTFIEERVDWREKFIQEYCVKRPAQPIRWIRSIFFDDTEQIETILEYFDKIKESATADTLERMREIVDIEINSTDSGEVLSYLERIKERLTPTPLESDKTKEV